MKQVFIVLSVALFLSACSPHPGAGYWLSQGSNTDGFIGLAVQYDGKAELYVQGKEEAAVRCFWGGESAETISMDCVVAENTEIRRRYSLHIAQPDQAELISGAKTIAVFKRSDKPMEK
jgi:hypothetical protein